MLIACKQVVHAPLAPNDCELSVTLETESKASQQEQCKTNARLQVACSLGLANKVGGCKSHRPSSSTIEHTTLAKSQPVKQDTTLRTLTLGIDVIFYCAIAYTDKHKKSPKN
jgi:hypothetical protein